MCTLNVYGIRSCVCCYGVFSSLPLFVMTHLRSTGLVLLLRGKTFFTWSWALQTYVVPDFLQTCLRVVLRGVEPNIEIWILQGALCFPVYCNQYPWTFKSKFVLALTLYTFCIGPVTCAVYVVLFLVVKCSLSWACQFLRLCSAVLSFFLSPYYCGLILAVMWWLPWASTATY
jgi:hypothetical protein